MGHKIATLRRSAPRDPFIIFLIVSGAIILLYWAVAGRKEVIEVPLAVQRSLLDDYALMTGQKADAAARQKLIDDYVGNEMLFREAVDRGMHMSDKTTKQRLIDRVRFMISGAPPEPAEDDLLAWYASHNDLYRAEPWISLEHVFFEGDSKPVDSDAILQRLSAGQSVAGEEFWMGKDLPNYGLSMLRGIFGQELLDTLGTQQAGQWFGPVRSPRGWHFVKVTERGDARLLPYPAARDQVREDYLASKSGAAVQDEIGKLKQGYAIRVES